MLLQARNVLTEEINRQKKIQISANKLYKKVKNKRASYWHRNIVSTNSCAFQKTDSNHGMQELMIPALCSPAKPNTTQCDDMAVWLRTFRQLWQMAFYES